MDISRNNKRICAVCGGKRSNLLFQQDFSTMSSGSLLEGYNVVACQDCGFCFADNIPEQTAFDAYYREMSKYEHQDRLGQGSEYNLAKFQAITSILKPFLPDIQTRILEIGCATGTLLSLLKESGYKNVLGVDPSLACAEAAHRLYGIRVLPYTLSNLEVPDRSFDFIILAGVLEHVCELGIALARLWNMLSSDGCIYVSVPDASRYVQGEDAPFQEFSVEHINFFGPISLTNLMSANSFSQILCQQSMIQANYRTTTPVIHAIYRKSTAVPSTGHLTPDIQTEFGLIAYIHKSLQADDRPRSIINEIISSGRPIIVWGTGAHTLRLLANSRLGEAKILAFVDSNPRYQGKQLNGTPIIAPTELTRYPVHPILISSRVFQEEIFQQIRGELRLGNAVIRLYGEET